MARYLYSELASAVEARFNCTESNNQTWLDRWTDEIESAVKTYMPSGSGFNNGTQLDLDASHGSKLVFNTAFHHMHESGMYDGWTDHTVTVTPSFRDVNIRISGRNRNDIKEYIHEEFSHALMTHVPPFGYASLPHAKEIEAAMDKLTREMEQHLVAYVDAWVKPGCDWLKTPNVEYWAKYWAPEQARELAETFRSTLAQNIKADKTDKTDKTDTAKEKE